MSNDQQPLAVFEAKAVATRERLKRSFLSTLFFMVLLVIHTNTNLFPTALAAFILLAMLFLGLLFLASLMQFAFMRRSRLDVYPQHVVYYRGKKPTEYRWSDLTNFKTEVVREADDIDHTGEPIISRGSFFLLRIFILIFVGDPPNYTLNLEFGSQKITMKEIAGDYQFLVRDLLNLIRPIWLESIQMSLEAHNNLPFADVILTPQGIQKKNNLIEWQHIKAEWYADEYVREYTFMNIGPSTGGMFDTGRIISLPLFAGEILRETITQQLEQKAKP